MVEIAFKNPPKKRPENSENLQKIFHLTVCIRRKSIRNEGESRVFYRAMKRKLVHKRKDIDIVSSL